MGSRWFSLASLIIASAAVVEIAVAGGSTPRTKVTVWAAPPVAVAFGGLSYGGVAPTTGAMITEQREVDVPAGGEVKLTGIAATVDPASVQLRDLTEPTVTITEQRFTPGATTPTDILARHVDDVITVVTAKGDVTGVLRSVDDQVLVIEVGAGDARHLQVMRRDGYVQDVRLPAGSGVDKPTLAWRLASKKPGKHTVELSYRADGMVWSADYLAVLDDTSKSVDFSAWATVRNATGTTFDAAELTLVNGGNAGSINVNPYAHGKPAPAPTPTRYAIATPVHLGSGQSVQVELVPAKVAAKARSVVTYEAMPDPSAGFQQYANTDCSQFNGAGTGSGHAEVAIELDVSTRDALPDGKVRLFRRRTDRLEVVSEEPLHSSPGLARIHVAANSEVSGERRAVSCTLDERAHTVLEKIEVKVENRAKQAATVVIREFAWRWPVWHVEGEDGKSVRAGAQTLEYPVSIPAGGKKTVTYSILYSAW